MITSSWQVIHSSCIIEKGLFYQVCSFKLKYELFYMGRKKLKFMLFTENIPLGFIGERGKWPRQGDEPRGGNGGVEAFWKCWVGVASSAGDEEGEQLSWSWREGGRLSAALQKLPVWVPATRAGHGRGPCPPACPPAPPSTCRPAWMHMILALAHLRVSRSGPWQSTELAHP